MQYSNVILFDNQDITRIGIRAVAQRVNPDATITEVSTVAMLTDALKKLHSALVIIDLRDSGVNDTEQLLHLSTQYSKAGWLLFSSEITKPTAQRLSTSPAFGMLLKDCREEEIQTALTVAFSGERYLCHQIMDLLLSPVQESNTAIDALTTTETEILRLTALGKTVKEIAEERFSSTHTITAHKRNIFKKLHVNTSYEATKVAIRAGLIDLIEYYI